MAGKRRKGITFGTKFMLFLTAVTLVSVGYIFLKLR